MIPKENIQQVVKKRQALANVPAYSAVPPTTANMTLQPEAQNMMVEPQPIDASGALNLAQAAKPAPEKALNKAAGNNPPTQSEPGFDWGKLLDDIGGGIGEGVKFLGANKRALAGIASGLAAQQGDPYTAGAYSDVADQVGTEEQAAKELAMRKEEAEAQRTYDYGKFKAEIEAKLAQEEADKKAKAEASALEMAAKQEQDVIEKLTPEEKQEYRRQKELGLTPEIKGTPGGFLGKLLTGKASYVKKQKALAKKPVQPGDSIAGYKVISVEENNVAGQ